MYLPPMSDDATPAPATPAPTPSLRGFINSEPVSTAAAVALTYHGYKRTGSILWALFYGAMGKWVPAIAVPVSMAQGFGEEKPCACAERKPRP